MEEQLVETWRIHSRINLYLLAGIAPAAFAAPAPAKGRSFVQMFAHIHNVRLMWLQSAAPELLGDLQKIEKETPMSQASLEATLRASGQAIEQLLQKAMAAGGKVRGFKPHAPAFLGYLIAHEAYHHGEIGVALTLAGYPLERQVAFGLWEWGVR